MSSEDVSHLVSQETIEKAVKNFVDNEPFSIQKMRVTRASDEIQGFTSIILRVSVDFTVGGKVRTASLIVKHLPIVEAQLKLMSKVFAREVFYYQTVVPKFLRFCEPPFPLPTCYYALHDGSNDVLILEDLQSSNFKTLGFDSPLELQHCKLVVRELAKLHAASVAVEIEVGQTIDKMFPIYKEDLLFSKPPSKTLKSMITENVNVVLAICEEISEFKHLVATLKEKLDTIWEQFEELVQPRTDQMNVLCHADCWLNNMMFRFDDNGYPIDVKIVDMQIGRYASPFTDILQFLHLSGSKRIRNQHLNDILEEYASSFNKSIAKFNISVKSLQVDQVRKDYDSVRLYGVLVSAGFKPLMLLREEILPTSHNDKEKFESMYFVEKVSVAKAKLNTNAGFREEMHAMISELCDIYQL